MARLRFAWTVVTVLAAMALVAGGCDDGGSADGGPADGSVAGDGSVEDDAGGSGPACGPLGECDILDADSCGEGMGCIITRETETSPLTSACGPQGALMEGAACDAGSGAVQCAPGLTCHTNESVCRSYCCTNDDCPVLGQTCAIFDETTQPELRGLGQCTQPCNFEEQTGCPEGQSCYIVNQGAQCLLTGTLATGAACDGTGQCQPRHLCASVGGGGGTCIRICNQTTEMTDPVCQMGEVCSAQTAVPTPLGLCIPGT